MRLLIPAVLFTLASCATFGCGGGTLPAPSDAGLAQPREAVVPLLVSAPPEVPFDGTVRLKLYKGNVILAGRKSAHSLYNPQVATFEEDSVYRQADAEGFIRLNALRLRIRAVVEKKADK